MTVHRQSNMTGQARRKNTAESDLTKKKSRRKLLARTLRQMQGAREYDNARSSHNLILGIRACFSSLVSTFLPGPRFLFRVWVEWKERSKCLRELHGNKEIRKN